MYVTNQNASGEIKFGNNGAHGVNVNMKLTSRGPLGIGTTAPSGKHRV